MATELIVNQTVGGNVDFGPYSIETIDIGDLKVTLDGVLQTLTTEYTVDEATSTVTFVTAPDVGQVVRIFRETPVDAAKAVLSPGSSIRAQNLNDNTEQALFAIQEIKDQYVTKSSGEFVTNLDLNDNRITNLADPVDQQDAVTKQYLEDNYFDDDTETILSSEAWPDNDTTIATTAAIDNRVDAKIDSAITGDIGTDGTGITVTNDGDGTITLGLGAGSIDFDRIKDVDIITSAEAWNSSDTQVATTQAIDDYIDTAITNDIGVDATGLTLTDDGDGTITLGIGANSVDLDRIKDGDIISLAEQNAGSPAPADNNIFTASAAARRFDTLVQLATPTGSTWEVGKTWLQNDDDLTLSIWNGSGWTAVSSGGTFTEQPSVVYVDQASGDDANTGHRISTPKATIKAAIEQINAEIGTEITSGGSGYVSGSYSAVPLTGGNGTGLTADITVSGGVVTSVTVNSAATLENYSIGDVLSANNADLGGSGSGLQITVNGDGDGQIVVVSAGVYQEVAPIQIKRRNVSIIGQALRSCIVHPTPATETNTLFELNSGSYISSLTLTGMKAGTTGTNADDAVLPADQGWNFAFYNDAFITKSPYIQNCTNFSDSEIDNNDLRAHNPRGGQAGDTDSLPTGGGLLVNGATPHDNSPLRSMVCDSYTHVGLNGPGILVTNNGYAQCTSSYAFFNRYHIKALNGGQANLAASTTDFGSQALVADGRSTTAIFTAALSTSASDRDITFTIDAPIADASWHGTATRPASNMLVELNSIIYPILSATANGSGWDVTISRPNPSNRSENLGLNGAVATPATASFFLRSMIASSGHTMEYVGSGTNYSALPENGGVPDETQQIVESNNGKVWTAITDHNGKFKIGGNQTDDPIFEVDQQLGFVTIPEGSIAFNLLSDQTPQLGGNLDVNGNEITSNSNGDIVINPNGTGDIELGAPVGIGVNDPGAADLAIVHPRDATNFARVSIGQNVDGQGSTGGNHLGLWYGNANSDRADIFTSAGNMNFWVDGAGDGTGQFTFGRTFNTEWMRIDDSGRLLVGTSTALTTPAGSRLTVAGNDFATSSITGIRYQDNTNGASLLLMAANGTEASPTIVSNDDELGKVRFYGYDGTDFASSGASIECRVDGTPSENVVPGRLEFWITDDAGATQQRMTIDSDGFVGIGDGNPEALLHIGTTDSTNSPTLVLLENLGQGNNTGSTIFFRSRVGTAFTDASIQGLGTGTNNSALLFSTENGSGLQERIRIDSAGRLLVGTSSSVHVGSLVQIRSDDVGANLELFRSFSGQGTPPRIRFSKSRGSEASPTAVSADDLVGELRFNVHDGTDYTNYCAAIRVEAEADAATDNVPGRIVFATTEAGGASPTERMRIDSDGFVGIGVTPGSSRGPLHVHEPSTSANTYLKLSNGNTGTGANDGTDLAVLTDGDFMILQRENANIHFSTNGTTKASVLSGGGISFNGDTAAANALSDYEEGTWTPGLTFNGNSASMTFSTQDGHYIKIGKLVYCTFVLILTNKGTSTGQAFITGLPEQVADELTSTSLEGGGVITYAQNMEGTVRGAYTIACQHLTTTAQLFASPDSNEFATNLTNGNFANNTSLRGTFTYMAG